MSNRAIVNLVSRLVVLAFTNTHSKIRLGIAFCLWVICCVAHQPVIGQPPPSVLQTPNNATFPLSQPLSRWNGIPVIYISVGTSLREATVLDTGLNCLAALPLTQTRLKLPPSSTSTSINLMDTQSEMPGATLPEFQIGSLKLENAPLCIADIPTLLSRRPRPDAPAFWFGTPLFATYQVSFDFSKRFVLFEKPDTKPQKERGAVVVPLVFQGGRPYVRMTIPGTKPFLALVSTGTPGTILPSEAATKLKLKPTRTQKVAKGANLEVTMAQAVCKAIQVGKAEWKNASIFYIVEAEGGAIDKSFAVLGMDFLARYKLTINYAQSRMTLVPYVLPVEEDKL